MVYNVRIALITDNTAPLMFSNIKDVETTVDFLILTGTDNTSKIVVPMKNVLYVHAVEALEVPELSNNEEVN